MNSEKKLIKLKWGWISGVALGLGATVGVALESWSVGIGVAFAVAFIMVWRSRQRAA